MGNLIPLDAAKKEECEEIAKEYLETFGVEYVLAYGVEFIKMKIRQLDEEAFGEETIKKKLMYRKRTKPTEPHKMGPLTKKGAVIKSWKHRYFVVNPDFSVSYYLTEEVYGKSGKPKGVIHLAGYEVAESADNAKIEKLKSLAKKLGVDEESLHLPPKFPPHTFALTHERRRNYFITAADEDEKGEWVEMFRTCCRKTKGFKNEDLVGQAAFKKAYRRACDESGWLRRVDPSGGTEEQVLSETLVEIINTRVLSSVYSEIPGNFKIRRKVSNQVIKILDAMLLPMVAVAYNGLVETTEKMKEPFDKIFDEKKEDVAEVQKKIVEKLADALEAIVDTAFEEVKEDIKNLYEDLKELTVRTSKEMRNECVVRLMERLVQDTKKSQDVDAVIKKNYRKFDKVIGGTCTWDHWYKVYNMEKEAIGIVNKYKDTFDIRGGYCHLYPAHDILAEVSDAAFFTFEQTFDKQTKDSDILKDNKKASEKMEKVKDEVIKKYDHDSKTSPHDVSFQLTTTHLLEYVSKKIDPLTKDIRKTAQSLIPEPLKEIISIQDRYELYMEECVKDFIRRAVGIDTPKEKGKTKQLQRNKKSKEENGNEPKDKKEKEEKEETNEEEENGDATEENGEEVNENGMDEENGEEGKENGDDVEENNEENGEDVEENCEENGEENGEDVEENCEENGEENGEDVEEDAEENEVDEDCDE